MIERNLLKDEIRILDPDSRETLAGGRWNPEKTWPGLGKTGGHEWYSPFPWIQEILDRFAYSTAGALEETIMETLKRRKGRIL
jgi:hypothetical protein